MFRRKNLRALRVDFSVTNADVIDPVHQLRDQIKIETGAAESRYLLLRHDYDVRIFDRVIEVVGGHDAKFNVAAPYFQGCRLGHPSILKYDGGEAVPP